MTRRLITLAALAALLASVASIAPAAKKKSLNVNTTAKALILETSEAGESTVLGDVQGSLGKGVLRYVTKPAEGLTQDAAGTVFTKKGSLTGKGTITLIPQPDGSIKTEGAVDVTSGTGAYKGFKGPLEVDGVIPADQDQPLQLTFNGTLKRK